jgi:hypothetical protein
MRPAPVNAGVLILGGAWPVLGASRGISVEATDGSHELELERQWITAESTEPLRIVEQMTGRVLVDTPHGSRLGQLPICGPARLSVLSPPAKRMDAARVKSPPARIWPWVRRALSELRDRSRPGFRLRNRLTLGKHSSVKPNALKPIEP